MSAIHGLTDVHSAWQVRLKGHKGVLAIYFWLENLNDKPLDNTFQRNCKKDSLLRNKAMQDIRREVADARLVLRPSIYKFDFTHIFIEVVAHSLSTPFHLTRQTI